MGFPGGSDGKESTLNVGNLGSIPGFGRSPGEGNSYSLQYSGLENSMDCMVHAVAKKWTRLRLLSLSLWGFPDGSDSKESACDAGRLGFNVALCAIL